MTLLRLLLGVCLVAAIGAIGYYFGQAGRPRQFIPPPEKSAVPKASQTAPASLPEPPRVDTGSGSNPVSAGETPKLPVAAAAGPPGTAKLGNRQIGLPIAGLRQTDILDTFNEARGSGERRHEASDIMAPRGTPVLAVDDGVIKKLFNSKPGGITIYQYDPAETYCYYYAHLDRYADGLREGMILKRGEEIGYVGTTGNSPSTAPHLHFAILELGPSKESWKGMTPLNPYPLFMTIVGSLRTH